MLNRRIAPALLTVIGVASFLALPTSAGAAVSCVRAGTTAEISLGVAADVATVTRSGTAIQVNGASCGTATVNNIDEITATGTNDSSQRVVLDLGGGAFAPGVEVEAGAGALSEIEIVVDFRNGSAEEVQVIGSTGDDTAIFGGAGARLNADTDIDLTFSGLDQVELDGNEGADTLSADGGGTSGSPFNRFADIDGDAGADTLRGGNGSDTVLGGTDDDEISGGVGSDTLRGNENDDEVSGNAGGDTIDGDLGVDTLSGGQDGDNLNLNGGAAADGADDMSGGPGSDRANYSARVTNTIVKLDNVANDGADADANGAAEEGDNVRADIESVTTGNGNDVVDGSLPASRARAHTLDANGGNDTIKGGDEDDSLYGDAGDDSLDSGDEDDYLDAGAGTDTLTADDGTDTLYPGADNDTLDAGAGNDYLDGGTNSGSGADSYKGGTGYDRLYLGSRTSDVRVELDNAADDGTDVDGNGTAEEGDNYRSDLERIDSGAGNDVININVGASKTAAADNEVYGSGGNDQILTGPGEDYIEGGLGNDTITGNEGEDRAFGGAGADNFKLKDGFFDHADGGAGDAVNDTGQFDAFDETLNFP